MKKKTSKIKKLTKGSKILIGTTTTLATGAAVVLPVTLASKKDAKANKKNEVVANESEMDPFLEALENLTEAELESIDDTHLKKANRKNWFSGDEEMDKWIKKAIHEIKGLEKLPNDDIKILPEVQEGKVNIEIHNNGKIIKILSLKGFVKKVDYDAQKLEVQKKIDDIKSLVSKPGKEKWNYKVKADTFDSNDFENHVKKTLNIKEDDNFSYNLTYPKVKENKELEVTIEIKNGAATETKEVTFNIFGIDKNNEDNLANAKTVANGAINQVDLPNEDSDGDDNLFTAIGNAKDTALQNINDAQTDNDVKKAKDEGLTNLRNAITNYNSNLATTKLANAKTVANGAINQVDLPNEDSDGNSDLFTAIGNAKDTALQNINDAQTDNDVKKAKDEGLTNLRNAITNYNSNLATTKLTNAKKLANGSINQVDLPNEDSDGNSDLFTAIGNAKDTALQNINDAPTDNDVTKAKDDGITEIQNAITAYNKDLANAQLANAKNTKKDQIDRINPQATLTDGATNPAGKEKDLVDAKTAAKDAIQDASLANLDSIFNTKKVKVEAAKDAYNEAIQAANLAFSKTQANDLVNIEYGKAAPAKVADGDQDLFDDIQKAKDKALADIQKANLIQEITQAKTDGLRAINAAINTYNKYLEFKNQSDIAQAQVIANEIINNINATIDLLPEVEVPSIEQAVLNKSKEDAKAEINGTSDKAAISNALNKNLSLVKRARDALNQAIRKANAQSIFDMPQTLTSKPLMLDDFVSKVNDDYEDISSQELKEKFNLEDVPSAYTFRYKVTQVDQTKDEVLVTVELQSQIDSNIQFEISFTKKGLPTLEAIIRRIWDPRLKNYPKHREFKRYPSADKKWVLSLFYKSTYYAKDDFILSDQTIEVISLGDLLLFGGQVDWWKDLPHQKLAEILTRILETRGQINDNFRNKFRVNILKSMQTEKDYSTVLPKVGTLSQRFYDELTFEIVDKTTEEVYYTVSLEKFYMIGKKVY